MCFHVLILYLLPLLVFYRAMCEACVTCVRNKESTLLKHVAASYICSLHPMPSASVIVSPGAPRSVGRSLTNLSGGAQKWSLMKSMRALRSWGEGWCGRLSGTPASIRYGWLTAGSCTLYEDGREVKRFVDSPHDLFELGWSEEKVVGREH